ncbi:ABC transporter ATP-binding protein [Helicobacter kayseriensis]|uniref:ABC transporter ATP-binding protein n=1 Tax=Helicobacter kayseriensis TaxID=2905877 RepID=UPI001E5E7175|nr:ATP-binding cassette domain-containing protein [Helicobacter kayseriensis]MCE3046582.1 ATP-binding cassette domain-containing protein [Helicobacter kayseriensis]MCE3048116.1 ATP-binding cassette domain-containing protein [Helicobacter kayseriensis]
MITFDFGKKLKGAQGEFELHFKGEISNQECIGIFGASGAGKSTILRIFAGLEKPDWGELCVDGEKWNAFNVFLPPQKREVGVVFQNYALFPHLNVGENVGFGKGVKKEEVRKLLEMMELDQIAQHPIHKLSGGQAQRVAIARALARQPKILLLDEPLSALDYKIKNKLIDELNSLQKELGFVMILVSHQISEIYRLSNRIFELDAGNIVGIKTPKENFEGANVALNVEVLSIEFLGICAQIKVLLNQRVFSFVCHPKELEGICIGDHIEIMLKSFSPLIIGKV